MRVPIITYHAVGDGPFPLWTSSKLFETHLDAFSKLGYETVSLARVAESLTAAQALPENAIVLTFDDGYDSVYREAFPRLCAKNFTATIFIVSGYCGGFNQWPTQRRSVPIAPLLNWDRVSELVGAGWELGVHTDSHAPLGTLPRGEAEAEILKSKEKLEKRVGRPASVFAFPYGDFSASILRFVQRSFVGAAGTRLGFVQANSNPFMLPRIDACYLTPFLVGSLPTSAFKPYLGLRQTIRALRGRFSQQWEPAGVSNTRNSF